MHNKHSIAGLSAGLAAASIWGSMYVVSKLVMTAVPPFTLLTLRLIIGATSLGIVIFFRNQRRAAEPASSNHRFKKSFLVGVIGYGISLGFQFVGTDLSTASNGVLVTASTPAFVLLFAPSLLGEKATAKRITALVISTLGVIAVIDPRTAELSPSLFWGNMSLVAASLTWALYSVLVRKVSGSGDVLVASTVMFLGGLPTSIAFSAWEINTQAIGTITPMVGAGVFYIGIVSTAVAMFFWNYAFAELPAAVASLTFFAQPVVGILLGWLFLSEKLTPLFIFGGILIAIGIVIASRE